MLDFEGPNADEVKEFVARAVMLPRSRLEQVESRLRTLGAERALLDQLATREGATAHVARLRTFLDELAYQVVRLRDAREMLNPRWIADQLEPTARALALRQRLEKQTDSPEYRAFAALTALFGELPQG